jgi:hypothetical protein
VFEVYDDESVAVRGSHRFGGSVEPEKTRTDDCVHTDKLGG